MKVIVAIDSFKGCITSLEAGKAVETGIKKAVNAEVIVKPLADGGEGTTDALVSSLNGRLISLPVTGPLKKTVTACYGYIEQSQTAMIEIASAAGIMLTEKHEKNPLRSTTYGVGELIKDAIKRGCKNFIIGLGGSATNDCGIGMLTALGFEFLDKNGCCAGIDALSLGTIETISAKHALPELKECRFKIACDVRNPLCGENGATYVYGPQKGVTEDEKKSLDLSLLHFAELTKDYFHHDYRDAEGAGAAGGLGFAFLSYFHSVLQPGIDLVIEAVELEKYIKDADMVITGEGRLDGQTAMGKAPMGVALLAEKYGVPVIALAGSIAKEAKCCNEKGITAYFPILKGIITLEDAMKKDTAIQNIVDTTEQIFRLIKAASAIIV